MAESIPPSHSYLVLKENPVYPQGSLVELKNNLYYGHSHLWYTSLTAAFFSPDELAPLTEEECGLLDAIGDDGYAEAHRYAIYSTSGKLAWGVGLKVGDSILAKLPKRILSGGGSQECVAAILRSITPVLDPYGTRRLFGVEIMDPHHSGAGTTNGSYAGKQYFSCEDKHGLFLSLEAIEQPPHSYLALQDVSPYPRGALLEFVFNGNYRGHSHKSHDVYMLQNMSDLVSSDNVAPLTEEECLILDAIGPGIKDDADRYTVYSTPGKLAWGVGLKVGDIVLAQLPDKSGSGTGRKFSAAIVRSTEVNHTFGKTKLFGLQIMGSGLGNTDGTYHQQRYFSCRENGGLFLSLAGLKQPRQQPRQQPLPSHSYLMLQDTPPYSRGAIVQQTSDGLYRGHTHLWYEVVTPVFSEDIAPLTQEECVLLDSIGQDENMNRYVAYDTLGKLAWGVGLKVGDMVLARVPKSKSSQQDQYVAATIRIIGVSNDYNYRSLFGVEITDKQHYGSGDTDGSYTFENTKKQYFTCKKKRGLFLTLAEIKPTSSCHALSTALKDSVLHLGEELREKTQALQLLTNSEERLRREVTQLQEELSKRTDEVTALQWEVGKRGAKLAELRSGEREQMITRLEQDVREKDNRLSGLQSNLQDKDMALSGLRDQLAGQRERHVTELRQVRQEAEQYQQELREERVRHQQLVDGISAAMRGEAVSAQALELWELPREEVHISQTLLGTGGWGYVARGTFRGQAVAVKCLHRGILSPQNEGRLRREISIMAQVRHPNLLLLIGAVLTVEGAGPLIVTELLDRSLRLAYEEGVLEERSKVPVLRDVSSALTYLHSHRTPIIHRDVSSANVLLEAICDGQWKGKLSDFGSANLTHLATTPAEGAAVYAAPEVSTEDRSRQTPKIDVYSFGVLVCEVCLSRFPPERRELPTTLSEVRQRAPNMFPLSRDCTSHAHQDRPTMREVLERIDQLKNT